MRAWMPAHNIPSFWKEAEALLNRVGVFEGLRVLAERGVPSHTKPLLPTVHFEVVAYRGDLHHERVLLQVPLSYDPSTVSSFRRQGESPLPQLLIPQLKLVDLLPKFFRYYVSGKHIEGTSESDEEQRRYLEWMGDFVNDFLNGAVYHLGFLGWSHSSQWLKAIPKTTLQTNPHAQTLRELKSALDASPVTLSTAAHKVVFLVPSLASGGLTHGLWRWGVTTLLKRVWPYERFQVEVGAPTPVWGKLHPTSLTYLGEQCGRLGEDFYLGTEVRQECTRLPVTLVTSSPRLLFALQPGPMSDLLHRICTIWLHPQHLTCQFNVRYTGAMQKVGWQLLSDSSEAQSASTSQSNQPPVFRLGHSTFLG